MDISKLNRLTEAVRVELDCAQDAAKDFRSAVGDWQYARAKMNELISRLDGISQSFEGLAVELSEELKLEEAV